MPQHHLKVNNIAKSYGKRAVVIDVSIELASGQVVGLLGPNGAGKTTCFHSIVGLIRPQRGRVLLNEQDISHLPMHVRALKGIGYLPQESSIFRKLSVSDNLMAVLQLRSDLNTSQRKELMKALLAEFNITKIHKNLGYSLSGGERRRVEIARALASNPLFMLLDEPFAGVDPIAISGIKKIIKHLQQRNLGVLITDHNVRDTLDICDKVYIVGEGRVIAAGSKQEIIANKRVREIYLGNDFALN